MATEFVRDAHRAYIARVSSDEAAYEYAVSEHLRMSGVYWAAAALDLVGALDDLDAAGVVGFVLRCQHECGGHRTNGGRGRSRCQSRRSCRR